MTTVSAPRVSVVMPMYNAAAYLRPAIDSVLGQTFRDYEFIIVDDGSTDSSPSIVREYAEPRIVMVRQDNQGVATALNRGLALARGEYIARQDADDVSHSERFSTQVRYLDEHPDVAVLGTGSLLIDPQGRPFSRFMPFTRHDRIVAELRRGVCPLMHGAIMARRDALMSVGAYKPIFGQIQDVELWLRMSARYRLANIRDILYELRKHDGSITQQARLDLKIKAFARTGRLSENTNPDDWVKFIEEFDRDYDGSWRQRAFEAENHLRRAQMALARGNALAATRHTITATRLSPETIAELPGRLARRVWRTIVPISR